METVSDFVGSSSEMNMTTKLNSTQTAQADSTNCVEIQPTISIGCQDPNSPVVSLSARFTVEDVLYIGVIPLLMMLGVTVNALNIAVFLKQGLGDRVHFSLFSLSVTDLLVLTSMCVHKVNRFLAQFVGEVRAAELWEIPIIIYKLWRVPASFQMISMFISIVIAVDRCVCVTWPLHAARVFSTRSTGLVILVASVVIFAGNTFVMFKFDHVCAFFTGSETSIFYTLVPSELYKNIPMVVDVLETFILLTLVPFFSFFVIVSTTAITAIKLQRASAWRDHSAGSTGAHVINQKGRALTSMLIVISCIYITCVSPRVLIPLCRFFIPGFTFSGKLCNLMIAIEYSGDILVAFNSTANFFVYYKMGSSFRQTLHRLLPCIARLSSKKQTGTQSFKDQQ